MSLKKSCSCRFLVPVETTMRLPETQRRDQVGEGFAGARAGFHNEMTLVAQGGLDGLRHGALAGAEFVIGDAMPRACRRGRRTGAPRLDGPQSA